MSDDRLLIQADDLLARTDPDSCQTMAEVRDGVDRLDRALIALIGERAGYMRAAARIKPNRDTVRDDWRVEDVIAKVLENAKAAGVPDDMADAVWRELIEQSIQYEFKVYDQTRAPKKSTGS